MAISCQGRRTARTNIVSSVPQNSSHACGPNTDTVSASFDFFSLGVNPKDLVSRTVYVKRPPELLPRLWRNHKLGRYRLAWPHRRKGLASDGVRYAGARSSVGRRFRSVTKRRLDWYGGVILLLQQRSKHPPEMVVTPTRNGCNAHGVNLASCDLAFPTLSQTVNLQRAQEHKNAHAEGIDPSTDT